MVGYCTVASISVRKIADRLVLNSRVDPMGFFAELWRKLGDGGLRKAAYRGGWKPPEPPEGAIRHDER